MAVVGGTEAVAGRGVSFESMGLGRVNLGLTD